MKNDTWLSLVSFILFLIGTVSSQGTLRTQSLAVMNELGSLEFLSSFTQLKGIKSRQLVDGTQTVRMSIRRAWRASEESC